MHHFYKDIVERAGKPDWYDENEVPRYGKFKPDMVPDIYADQAVLMRIGCQGCQLEFKVALSFKQFGFIRLADGSIAHHDGTINKSNRNQIHYGDPPSHIDTDHGGSTMNCIDREIIEFWERSKRKGKYYGEYRRRRSMEGSIEEDDG